MKRAVILVLVVAIGIITIYAATAQAQYDRSYSFVISGDLNHAVSPSVFTDYYEFGFGVSAGMEFRVSPQWSFVGTIGYKNFSPAGSMIAEWWVEPGEYPDATNIEVSEGALQAVTIAVVGKGALRSEHSKVFPYAKGGFGLTIGGADEIRVDFDEFGSPRTAWQGGADSDANLSIHFALGVEFLLGDDDRSSIFADFGVALVSLEGFENPTIVPLTVGFKF